jgi:hypothetical protein
MELMIKPKKFIEDLLSRLPANEPTRVAIEYALQEQGMRFYNGAVVPVLQPVGTEKFKAGDWVVYDGWICQIIDVTEDGYCNSQHGFIPKNREDSMRLWTIEDSKPGDVLYTPKGCGVEGVLLIEGWKQVDNTGRTLCSNVGYRIEDDEIIVGGLGAIWWEGVIDPFYPATNEQKELLFEKIRENGYEYDSKKNRCIRKKAPEEYAIIINGVRHNLIKPQIEDCGKCSLDKFCDNFKEALCNSLVGGNTGMIFEKENSNKTKV